MTIFAGIGATEQTAIKQIGGSTGGGGGGVTVIPNGGTLSGTYEGDVFCEGDVSMAGAVTVEGKLTVIGTFTNTAGFELTVRADLFAKFMSFNRTITSLPQSNITVDGDFQFYTLDYQQCGGTAATLRVGGDLIGSYGAAGSYINANGDNDTAGATIIVYGNLTSYTISLTGGGSVSGNAGIGGNILVYGDIQLWGNLSMNGGVSVSTGFDAGTGGTLDVYGNAVLDDVYLYGGNGDGGNGGNGGTLDVHGNLQVGELQIYGGECQSTSSTHRAGAGGSISVGGNVISQNFLNLSAGDRLGALTASGSVPPANAGGMTVRGSLVIDGDFIGRGGDVFVTGFTVGDAGNGSSVIVNGDLVCADDFRANGGNNDLGNGGQGGYALVHGRLTVNDELEFVGGYAINGAAGNGGSLTVRSDTRIGELFVDGGNGTNGFGGNGGSVTVRGNLTVLDSVFIRGGNCGSANSAHTAGTGGSLNVSVGNLDVDGDVEIHGGNRFGVTAVSETNTPPNGGNLFVSCGDACVDGFINLYGGDVTTDFPNSVGGNGGNLSVFTGSLVCDGINVNGGEGRGLNGGNAGTVYVRGRVSTDTLNANGGPSNDSSVGGDAATDGNASSSVQFVGGATVYLLSMVDGAGAGAAPVGTVGLTLGGFCTFGSLTMVNRAGAQIKANNSVNATIKIGTMPVKNTLNAGDGTPTANISASVAGSIYTSGAAGVWYGITGALV